VAGTGPGRETKPAPSLTSGRADYGFDQPYVPILLGLGGVAAVVLGLVSWLQGWGVVPTIVFLLTGVFNVAGAGLYVYATRRGKHQVWAKILDSTAWRGNETVLDLGCGRGAVLIAAARRLPQGRAVGVDIWKTRDQSGNSMEVTRRNAEIEGVGNRVQLETADIRDLAFDGASFDTVVSSLVLHNIHSTDDRRRALAEAVRVLRPGGRLFIADIMHLGEYRRELEQLGLTEVKARELGPRMWYGNPFLRTRLVSGVKPGTPE
jgi:SAM-dependent methyltransferase